MNETVLHEFFTTNYLSPACSESAGHVSVCEQAPVSVVIPAYCAKSTIIDAIKSVAAQTLRPMEVIVVDDGSTDGTADCVKKLIPEYGADWLKLLILDRNQGVASARNAGWSMAKSAFIAFLDADDLWHPQKIQYQYDYFCKNSEAALCGHAFCNINNMNACMGLNIKRKVESIGTSRLLLSNPFVTPSVMLRANLPFRFHAGKRYMEDHLLWMEISLAGFSVVKLSAPLALIRKAQFGESGLSAALWKMEKGELHNYWALWESGRIGLCSMIFLALYSMAKYVRRLMIVTVRSMRWRITKNVNG